MHISIPLPRKTLPGPWTGWDRTEVASAVVFPMPLFFVAMETGFIAEGEAVATELFADIGFGVFLPVFPGLWSGN